MGQPILVVGSANMDLVFEVEKLPGPGETLMGSSFRFSPGGKGANQAVAIAKLGGNVGLVCSVGADAFGDRLLECIEEAGVGFRGVTRSESVSTGVAAIHVSESGENSITVVPGANGSLDPELVRSLVRDHPGPVLTQLEVPLDAVEAAMHAKGLKILNPAPAMALPDPLLSSVDILVPNETEALALTGIDPVDEAACRACAEALLGRGVGSVVLTLGSRGCYVAHSSSQALLPAPRVAAVDTTAAGDAFCGALTCFLSEGLSLIEAARLSNCAGALAAMKHGAQASMPSREEVMALSDTLP